MQSGFFWGKHLTRDEVESFHLSTLRVMYDEAVCEYEKRRETRLGRLIANRELPLLKKSMGDFEQMMKTIYLAGGCFWGMQKFLDQFDGVISTEVGYANGPDEAPTYEDVCSNSGHAETVKVVYDESKISLTKLLGFYFMVIDPLSVNRQGNDWGIQYRTGIYYTDKKQLPETEAVYREQEEKAGAKLAVELEPIRNFFSAEEYHQKYLDKNPGGYCHIPDRYFKQSNDT